VPPGSNRRYLPVQAVVALQPRPRRRQRVLCRIFLQPLPGQQDVLQPLALRYNGRSMAGASAAATAASSHYLQPCRMHTACCGLPTVEAIAAPCTGGRQQAAAHQHKGAARVALAEPDGQRCMWSLLGSARNDMQSSVATIKCTQPVA
jgi:hypothetical protein